MIHSAKIVNNSPLLDQLKAKQTGKSIQRDTKTVDIYAEETKNLGFNLADYYYFSKIQY